MTVTKAKSALATNRDAKAEAILEAHGVKYEYVQLVDIKDIERHTDAQSRLSDVPKKRVMEYAEKMKQGEVFPPIILWEDGVDGYLVLDGNTRIAASKKRGATSIDAYIVVVGDKNEAIVLSAIFNGTNGTPLTVAEVRRAVIANEESKNPLKHARMARDYGVPVSTITKIQNILRAKAELASLSVDVEQLTETAAYSIGSLSDAAVKRDLANLAVDAELPQAAISELVKKLKKTESETDRLRVISDERVEREGDIEAVRSGRRLRGNPGTAASMIYGRLVNLIDQYDEPSAWVPVSDTRRAEAEVKVKRITEFFGKVLSAYAVADSVSAISTDAVDTTGTDGNDE